MSSVLAAAPCGVLAPRQASRQQPTARYSAPLAVPARQQRQQLCTPSSSRAPASRRSLVVAAAAQAEVRSDWDRGPCAGTPALRARRRRLPPADAARPPAAKRPPLPHRLPPPRQTGKLISKVEIPAFIPRADLLDQLTRWASIDMQENGVANVGCPCKVRSSSAAHGCMHACVGRATAARSRSPASARRGMRGTAAARRRLLACLDVRLRRSQPRPPACLLLRCHPPNR